MVPGRAGMKIKGSFLLLTDHSVNYLGSKEYLPFWIRMWRLAVLGDTSLALGVGSLVSALRYYVRLTRVSILIQSNLMI